MQLCGRHFGSLCELEQFAINNLFTSEYREDKKRIAYFNEDGYWWPAVFIYNEDHIIDYTKLGCAWPISCNDIESRQIGSREFLICLYDNKRDPGLFISL